MKIYYVVYKLSNMPGTGHWVCSAEHKQAAKEMFLAARIPHDHIIKVII